MAEAVFLVQLLLPLYDNSGCRVPYERFTELRDELTERFGGVTAFLSAPARGSWKQDDGQIDRDEVVMCEVMVDPLERAWWVEYRKTLEGRFGQRELVVRALPAERI